MKGLCHYNIWTLAAPLRIVASTTGALVVSVWSDIRQCSRLALTARLGFPPVDNAGGAYWFRGRRTGQDPHYVTDIQYTASRKDYRHSSLR